MDFGVRGVKPSELQRKTPPKRRTPLSSNSTLGRGGGSKPKGRSLGSARKPYAKHVDGPDSPPQSRHKSRAISPASKAQREKVRDQPCVACYGYAPVDPAHLAARTHGGCDHPDCVIPLCRLCHRQFDDGRLDVQRHIVSRFVPELQHALGHYDGDLIALLHRLTGERYVPEKAA